MLIDTALYSVAIGLLLQCQFMLTSLHNQLQGALQLRRDVLLVPELSVEHWCQSAGTKQAVTVCTTELQWLDVKKEWVDLCKLPRSFMARHWRVYMNCSMPWNSSMSWEWQTSFWR